MKKEKSKIATGEENLMTPAAEEEQSLSEEGLDGVTGGLGYQSFHQATDATNVLKDLAGQSNPKPLNKGVMGN